ncbi:MAG: nucleotidyltransferase family protein [Paludibacter sp.]|nr:nucleotidyltransferase family protein [Paludibacter sp.]
MHLTPSDQLILSSVKINPDQADLDILNALIPQIGDWDNLTKNITDRGIGPLFFKKLPLLSNSVLIPGPALSKLQQVYFRTLSRSMVLYDAFSKVAKALTADGIQVVALKGIYLSEHLYKDIGLRQFSDIDLLVKIEDGEKCLEILAGLGYQSTCRKSKSDDSLSKLIQRDPEFVHYPPMVNNDVSVEIHIKLHLKNKNYDLKVEEFIESAIPVTINKIQVHALHLYDLIIHLCIHLDKHFFRGQVQFTGFIDIANLLYVNKNNIDWSAFKTRCRKNKGEKTVFKYLLLTHKYFNAPIPETLCKKYAYLLSEDVENLFYVYLHGFKGSFSSTSIPVHWQNIRKTKSFGQKLKYLLLVIFPPKEFMLQSYSIKKPRFFRLYYPYRYWIGLKGLFKLIIK